MRATGSDSSARHTLLVLLVVYTVFWVQFSVVRPDNFGGIDEWMVLSVGSRGALEVPGANRPLALLFHVPAVRSPGRFLETAFFVHGHYLVLAGLLTSLLLLRVAPERPDWALLAGVFACTWAPHDPFRLTTVYGLGYSGVTAATALVFFLLARWPARPVPVALAAALAFVTVRVFEAPLPLFLAAPVLLGALGVRFPRWAVAAHYGVLALAGLIMALPFLRGEGATWYQSQVVGIDLDPLRALGRLRTQFELHLGPFFVAPGAALLQGRAIASAALVAAALAALARGAAVVGEDGAAARRRFAVGLLAGLAGAAAGYAAFIVLARLEGASRTQFLAAPWIGIAVASAILLGGTLVPRRVRPALVAALAALWTSYAGVFTARMQDHWNAASAYRRQAGAARQMVALAAQFQPGTLLLFHDGTRTWLGTFVFHHAMQVVYGAHVTGCVANPREEIFYSCWLEPGGIRREPWPMLQRSWGEMPKTYAFGEVVVFRSTPGGGVTMAPTWPPELPPLPPGATYAPRARIVTAGGVPASRAVLSRLPAE